MIYSVWNWNTGRYDYFRSSGPPPGIKPRGRFSGDGQVGVRLEDTLPVLPSGAVKIGNGPEARGRVAIDNIALGPLGEDPTTPPSTSTPKSGGLTATALFVGGFFFLYKVLAGTRGA